MQCNKCLPDFSFKDKRGWKLQKYSFFFKYQATYRIHKSINSKFKILLSETFKTGWLRGVRYARHTTICTPHNDMHFTQRCARHTTICMSHNDKVWKITFSGIIWRMCRQKETIGQDLLNYLKRFSFCRRNSSLLLYPSLVGAADSDFWSTYFNDVCPLLMSGDGAEVRSAWSTVTQCGWSDVSFLTQHSSYVQI